MKDLRPLRLHSHDHQGHVICLRVAPRVRGQLIQNGSEELLRILGTATAKKLFQSMLSKGLALGILRFCDSVCVGNHEIARLKLESGDSVARALKRTDRGAS